MRARASYTCTHAFAPNRHTSRLHSAVLDTIIFALRGSFRQLTTLHVYHHVSITLVTAAFIRHDVNGDCTLAALANSFIHVLMYSHYFCSAFGLKTPWRKHLTSLQLLQFVGIFAQSTLAWLRGPSCGFPDWMKAMMICYQISMLALFGQFFVGAYAKPKASKPKASAPTPTRRKTRAKAE